MIDGLQGKAVPGEARVAGRRGVWLVVIFITIAVAVSAAGLVFTGLLMGRQPSVASNSTLVLRVGGDLQEAEPGGLVGSFFEPPPTVRSVVESLRKAKVDRHITSVVIRPTGTAALWAKVQEVRDAIVDFKSSKKPIIAYLEYGGEQEFYLASACDKVFLMPTASLDLTGMASYELFLRGTLDKIGAYPDALHIGEYKTAANTLTEHTYTPAHREMAESLNTDLYEQLVRGIADGRKKSEADVKTLIDHGPFLPEDALRAGLIDDLAYEDELDDKVKLGSGKIHYLDMNDYRQVTAGSLGLNRGPKIAVIYATGVIASGKSTSGQVAGSETLVEYLRKARADSSVKAIVLRVDSPGGSALASDVIWREVLLTKNQKPLIASMSDVAASGGYYISMPAHAIVAEPATLTGSIGVVMLKFVIDGTLKKIGMNLEGVTNGRFADLYSPVRAFSPEERQKVQQHMQATYDTFVEKAAQGRNTTPERIDAIGQGRVWTGRQAKEIGLVDELGGLYEAAAAAKRAVQLDPGAPVALKMFPAEPTLAEQLTQLLRGAQARTASLPLDLLPRELRDLHTLATQLPLGAPLLVPPSLVLLH
jgi:protease-4